MLLIVRKVVQTLAAIALVALIAGCTSAPSIDPAATVFAVQSPVELDRVVLLPDKRSVDVVVVGGAPLSDGKPCGADYALASSTISGGTLEVLVNQTATRIGNCALTEGVCCEHHFTVDLAPDAKVNRVRDAAAGFERVAFLTRPQDLYLLNGLPAGWEMRREWGDWGGTWTQLFSPASNPDPTPRSPGTLEFSTTLGGFVEADPGALQSPILVNGSPAEYLQAPNVDGAIETQLQWNAAGGQALTLYAFDKDFSIDEVAALANAATGP